MFDLSRITDAIGGLVSGSLAGEAVQAQSLTGLMQNVGLDPSILAGLSESEIAPLLASYGIDVTQLAEGELSQFVEGLGLGPIADVTALWGDGASET